MQSKAHSKLFDLYTLLKEDNDTVSAMGGDFVAEEKSFVDWKQAGLFEPETPEENRVTETSLKELTEILNKFEANIKAWQEKYAKLGAQDTVSKEQLGQYIAKSTLGLTKLD